MKFFSVALFAGAVLGQVSVISDALDNISSKTSALNDAVTGFSGAGDVAGLQSAAMAVISAINQGNTDVSGIANVGTAAVSLVAPLQSLASQVDDAISNLISKKTALTPYASVVLDNLNQIKSATQTFATTTYSKIDPSLVSTAQGLVAPIIASLNRGIAAFTGLSGGSSSSSASASATATATSVVSSETSTPTAPVYSTGAEVSTTLVTSAGPTAPVYTSAPVGTGSVVPTATGSISPSITSVTPAPYNPNGASQLTGGFAAAVVAAAVAVAAF